MRKVAFAAVALMAATPVLSQTAPRPGTDLTRMLNGAPPTSAPPVSAPPVVAPSPTTTAPARSPARPSSATPATSSATPPAAPAPSATVPPRAAPVTPAVTPPRATPSAAPIPEPVRSAPAAAPAVLPPPPPTVLNAAAVAALPFTVSLPTGFSVTTGRPGPNFSVYTIRRGQQPFVMVYAGPTSQFPIYSGETVQAAGRTSIVTTDGSQRRAVEHLFERDSAPGEIHVWVSSLEGADRIAAEQIAQSVGVR